MNEWAILAPGPSLTPEIAQAPANAIAVTSAYKLRPDAAALVANDRAFWLEYPGAVKFDGRKFSTNPASVFIERVAPNGPIQTGTNSALLALHVAITIFGARRILFYGLDMSADKGAHYFGEYRAPLMNTQPHRFEVFKQQFAAYAQRLPKGIEVINATKGSALKCFPPLTE